MALRFLRFSQDLAHNSTTRRIWFGDLYRFVMRISIYIYEERRMGEEGDKENIEGGLFKYLKIRPLKKRAVDKGPLNFDR